MTGGLPWIQSKLRPSTTAKPSSSPILGTVTMESGADRAHTMDDYFDFGEAAMPDAPGLDNAPNQDSQPAIPPVGTCLLHPHDDG